MVPELDEIPRRYSGRNIDLMLVHLGGTTIPSPSVPLLMVTMDAEMGIQLIKLIDPDVTVPIHYEYAFHICFGFHELRIAFHADKTVERRCLYTTHWLTSNSDYDVFLSPLEDFKKAVKEAGLEAKVVYLDRKDAYQFKVKGW